MEPEDYQQADEAAVEALLDDATLDTSLKALVGWTDFYGQLVDAGQNLTSPSTPPALPKAGAFWRLFYAEAPEVALAGNVFSRRAFIDIELRIQPNLAAGDTAWAKLLSVSNAIKARLRALSVETAKVYAAPPLASIAPRGGWPSARQRIGLHLEET